MSLVVSSKKRLSLYLKGELKEKLETLAKSRNRSLNNLIESCMEEIAQQAKKDGEIQ